MLKSILSKIGFSAQEAEIYLAALHWGTKPASVIAQKTGLNRVTAYQTLEKMVKKGIVSRTARASIKYYTAEKPEKIIDILKRDKAQTDNKIEMLSKYLPDFAKIINPHFTDPNFKLYTGIEGMKALYEDTLKGEGPIYAFESFEDLQPDIKEYLQQIYLPKRIRKKIPAQVIMPDNADNKDFRSRDCKSLRECRFIPAEEYTCELEINMYDGKVAFFSFRKEELFGAMLESEAIYRTLVSIFKLMWKHAK